MDRLGEKFLTYKGKTLLIEGYIGGTISPILLVIVEGLIPKLDQANVVLSPAHPTLET